MRRWLAAVVLAWTGGCVVSDADLGVRIGCETAADCPEGQGCEAGICSPRAGPPAEGEGEGEGGQEGEGEGSSEGEGEGGEGEGEGGTEGEGEGEGEGATEGEGEGEGEGPPAGYLVRLQAAAWSSPLMTTARHRASLSAGRPVSPATAAGGGYQLTWRGVPRLEVQR